MRLKLLLSVIIITMTNLAISQTISPELISASGDSFSNGTYQLDWSIGECTTASLSSGNYFLTQGFHQNSYVITLIEDLQPDVEMIVFPNPTSDFINLKIVNSKLKSLEYSILDFSGKFLQSVKMQSDLEQINFSNYATGTYLIRVLQNNQLIKSFKIIKQ